MLNPRREVGASASQDIHVLYNVLVTRHWQDPYDGTLVDQCHVPLEEEESEPIVRTLSTCLAYCRL